MTYCKCDSTPMGPSFNVSLEDVGDHFDASTYQQVVGCLFFFWIFSSVFRSWAGSCIGLALPIGKHVSFATYGRVGCYDTRVSTSGNYVLLGATSSYDGEKFSATVECVWL